MTIQLKNEWNEVLLQIDTTQMSIGLILRIPDSYPAKSQIHLIYGHKLKKTEMYVIELSPEQINQQIFEQCPDFFNPTISDDDDWD